MEGDALSMNHEGVTIDEGLSFESVPDVRVEVRRDCEALGQMARATKEKMEGFDKAGYFDVLLKKDKQDIQRAYQLILEVESTFRDEATAGAIEAGGQPSRKTMALRVMGSVAFYSFLAVAILIIYLFGGDLGSSEPRLLFGYSAMIVLSGSMEREYPRGSLIVTRQTDQNLLEIGDDITYMTGSRRVVTHRIVDIHEHVGANRNRGFQTQGLENLHPDSEMVYGPNVIGRVIWSSVMLGNIVMFIREHVILIVLVSISTGTFIWLVKRHFLSSMRRR